MQVGVDADSKHFPRHVVIDRGWRRWRGLRARLDWNRFEHEVGTALNSVSFVGLSCEEQSDGAHPLLFPTTVLSPIRMSRSDTNSPSPFFVSPTTLCLSRLSEDISPLPCPSAACTFLPILAFTLHPPELVRYGSSIELVCEDVRCLSLLRSTQREHTKAVHTLRLTNPQSSRCGTEAIKSR